VFERFTDRARKVVVFTQEEATLLGHNLIGTEHILLGLIREGDGIAARALESLDISLEAVRHEIEEIVGRGEAASTSHIPFSPRAREVLELSLREALQLGHNFIGTEHLLLGLIREREGVAVQVLQSLGVEPDRIRLNVIQRLYGYPAGLPGQRPWVGSMRLEVRPDASVSPFKLQERILLMLLINEGLTTSEIAEFLSESEERVGEIVQAVIEKLNAL
jgi:ATP-dependent Clp protease ATP-binding subunit ClpC